MGNTSPAQEPIIEQQTDLFTEQLRSNTNVQSHYKHQKGVKSQNTQNSGVPKFKCLLDVRGSKLLNFGLCSKGNEASEEINKRKTEPRKEVDGNSQGKSHLEPIVFSIIEIHLSSLPENQPQSKQSFDSTQRLNKHLSSTCDQDDHRANLNQVANDIIVPSIPDSIHIDINKQQFIRIKKQSIQHQYAFLSKLGQGAFGEVYKCENIKTKELRAIKLLKKSILLNPKVKQQFLQEFNLLKKIDHPNIIKIYEIYQTSQSMCIVSELCSGNSLGRYLKNKVRLTYETKRQILRQLFLGVNYLHHMNIIHRDLKPDNIVFIKQLTERSTPDEVDLRIIDLGLAIEEKQKVFKDWINIGTYNYMAPEAFTGIYSNKCDAWACGVIMFALLLDNYPFKGFDLEEVKKNIQMFSPLSIDFKNLSYSARSLMLNLVKINYVLRWSIEEALASEYFHTDSSACCKTPLFDKLASYHQGNGLVSATESYLALQKTNQAHQLQLAKYFHSINANKNGLILEDQFKQFFSGVPEEQVQSFFKKLDKNRSGSIDFGQFLVGMTSRRQLFTQSNLREVFDFIDVNKNGEISKEQLKHFLRALEKAPVNDLIDQIGRKDKNGVSFEQFKGYLLKERWM